MRLCLAEAAHLKRTVARQAVSPEQHTAAEAFALSLVADYATSPHAVYSDCAAVVAAAGDWPEAARGSSVLGGFYRHVRHAAGFQFLRAVRKVKAHQDLQGLDGAALVLARGTARANELATAAAARHPRISDAAAGEHAALVALGRAAVRLMAALWPKFPPIIGIAHIPRLPPADPPRSLAAPRSRHFWEFAGLPDIHLCLQCQALTHGRAGVIRRSRGRCRHRRWLAGVFTDPQDHTLAVALCPSGGPVVICLTCGAWARRIQRKLRQPCTRHALPSGAKALDRISPMRATPSSRYRSPRCGGCRRAPSSGSGSSSTSSPADHGASPAPSVPAHFFLSVRCCG